MSSSLSPSSSSASVSRTLTHHVFLSFRGADVRQTLLSHILGEFHRKGITPFIDNEMERGASLGPELLRAIKDARITIVIFSKNYASSSWCLDELVEVMKCKDERNQKVMTIFHQLQPADVRHQRGDFGQAFNKTCEGKSEELKQLWKKTLTDAANIHGDGVESDKWKSEAEMIAAIAKDVLVELQLTWSKDFDDYVGLSAHMERIDSLLCLDTNEVMMIGIWGPSGIGKTTISRVLLDKLSPKFQLSARIGDIKRRHLSRHDEYDAKKELQKELVCELLKQKSIKISHLEIAKERFHDKKVLIILDDVNELWQLQATVKYHQWFGGGSRIIITTQDRRVLEQHGIKEEDIYKVHYPTRDESLQIFCRYAFDQKHPHHDFEDLAEEVTTLASNLPLALRVMGSYFKQMTKEVWETELKFLKKKLHKDIHDILKFSYEALAVEEKTLFDDIACFFNGDMIEDVEEMIGDGLSRSLRVLEEKSLIFTDNGKIGMHTLLAKLVREEKQGCTFLVDAQKICSALASNTDNPTIRGIIFDLSEITHKLEIDGRVFEGMPSLEYLRIRNFNYLLSMLSLGEGMYATENPELHVPQGLKYLPYKLKLLSWDEFPMKSMPSMFHPNFLVKLVMRGSKLEKLWEGNPPLGSLKEISLGGSKNLKEIPNLSDAINLKRLNLFGCQSLVEIPSSIGNAINLEKIDISYCKSLVKIPSSIGNATNLEEMNLSHCTSLVKLPSSIGNATNLKEMNLSYCFSLVKLPSSIGNATNLEKMNLSHCTSLVKLPYTIGNLHKLVKLDMSGCSNLKVIPYNSKLKKFRSRFRKLRMSLYNIMEMEFPTVSDLYLSSRDIEEVPSSNQNLSPNVLPTNINMESLSKLDLSWCERLKALPEISISIEYLDLSYTDVEEVPSSIVSWFRLRELDLSCCDNLVSLPQLPDSLLFLNADSCESLRRIQGSFHNPHICLNFANCYNLSEEARELIKISDCKYAVLPGKELPAYFEHQAKGDLLTVKWDERFEMTSKRGALPLFLRFKACLLLPKLEKMISCHVLCIQNDQVIGSGLCIQNGRDYAPYGLFTENLYIFKSSISIDIPEIDVNHMKLEFQFKADGSIEIQGCGVHLKDPSVYDDHESADIKIRENLLVDTKRR